MGELKGKSMTTRGHSKEIQSRNIMSRVSLLLATVPMGEELLSRGGKQTGAPWHNKRSGSGHKGCVPVRRRKKNFV